MNYELLAFRFHSKGLKIPLQITSALFELKREGTGTHFVMTSSGFTVFLTASNPTSRLDSNNAAL